MLVSEKNKNKTNNERSVLNTVIHRTTAQKDVPFVKEDVVPAGRYRAEIVGVFDARTEKGKEAIDVVYSLANADGFSVRAKERYVMGGYRLEQLCEHWLTSGLLTEGTTYGDILGIVESVTVSYARKDALGTLQDRRPWKEKTVKSVTTTNSTLRVAEDEEEDILPLDDDDDYLEDDD